MRLHFSPCDIGHLAQHTPHPMHPAAEPQIHLVPAG
jgi:hypothetical protein